MVDYLERTKWEPDESNDKIAIEFVVVEFVVMPPDLLTM